MKIERPKLTMRFDRVPGKSVALCSRKSLFDRSGRKGPVSRPKHLILSVLLSRGGAYSSRSNQESQEYIDCNSSFVEASGSTARLWVLSLGSSGFRRFPLSERRYQIRFRSYLCPVCN
jgi:hypothetical protein